MNELSPRASALISAAGNADTPTAEQKARLKTALLGAVGAGAGVSLASVSAEAAGGAATGSTLKLLLGGVLMTGAVMGTWKVTQHLETSSQIPRKAVLSIPETAPVVVKATSPAVTEQDVSVTKPAPVAVPVTSESPPKRPARRARPRMAEPTAPTSTSNLAAEAALLAKVRVALRNQDHEAVLIWTDKHAQQFPRGMLTEERWAARAQALCALERWQEAKMARQSLEAVAPDSVHLPQICTQD